MDWQFYHWHLELSSRCTLLCPRCPRTEHPDIPWINKDMTLSFVQSFLDNNMLKKVKRITLCGDVGDPIYCKDFLKICRYFKECNPKIHLYIITNGSHKKETWWNELATILNEYDTINFSIDGFDQESNNLYRKNSNFESIIQGIKTIRNNKLVFINWATIVFKFNEDKLLDMQEYAKSLGCDGFQITKSTKFGSKYGDAYFGSADPLEPSLKNISSSHRYERQLINLSGRSLDNEDYLKTNAAFFESIKNKFTDSPIIPMCLIGNRGLYVNAEGTLFPCSWTSFPYKELQFEDKTIQWSDSFFAKNKKLFNLNYYSIDDILSNPVWKNLYDNFTSRNKSWVECLQKCNNKIVNYEYAVGYETN